MSPALSSMPEEILERILDHVAAPLFVEYAPRPAWHIRSSTPSSTKNGTTQIGPLLVNHTWLRIATPLHYRHVVLQTARQAALLADTLRANPELGHWMRSIRVEGTFDTLADVVPFCPNIEQFDMIVDNGSPTASTPGQVQIATQPQAEGHAAANAVLDAQVARFCASFEHMRNIKHLVVRKNAYLTQARPTLVFEQLGKAIASWKCLETVHIAFRYSPSPGSSSFATSLATAPNLRAVRALLPAIWNSTLLEISGNPALKGIQLTPDSELMGSHLFLTEARKHTRLMELIHAGTPVIRRRAQTLACSVRPASAEAASVEAANAQASRRASAAVKDDTELQVTSTMTVPSIPARFAQIPRRMGSSLRRLSG
ncbi:hypothetical protein B0H21DRAFT_686106 [Amylocystis lapponica]|nr:hypothetical protein B0H21DRAFT_686106 [Amylocystis lapponica]